MNLERFQPTRYICMLIVFGIQIIQRPKYLPKFWFYKPFYNSNIGYLKYVYIK